MKRSRTRKTFGKVGRVIYLSLLVGVVIFMISPSVIVGVSSFSNDGYISFPVESWGFRNYAALFASGEWLDPLVKSLTLGLVSASFAIFLGIPATLALSRTPIPGRSGMQFLSLGPLLAPGVAYAIALFALFARLSLLGTFHGLVLVHTTLILPFVLLIMSAGMTRVPIELEEASMSLGASRSRTWVQISIRLLVPAIAASFFFAFIHSFDEAVITSFLTTGRFRTLPVAIFDSVRFGVDPVITAIATLLTVGVGLLFLAYDTVLRRSYR